MSSNALTKAQTDGLSLGSQFNWAVGTEWTFIGLTAKSAPVLLKTAKTVGRIGAVIGIGIDLSIYNSKLGTPDEMGLIHLGFNLSADVVGATPFAPISVVYGAVDNFYPGGFPGLGSDMQSANPNQNPQIYFDNNGNQLQRCY